MPATPGRFLPLHSGGPAENMAIDQALLESVGVGCGPVLRLYTWSEPTLSLGYFQELSQRDGHTDSAGLACVRRATGGGAIVHDRELTYSIAIPLDQPSAGPRLDLYQQTHHAVRCVLSELGVRVGPYRETGFPAARSVGSRSDFLCFRRRTDEDLILCGYKVVGSAQRKTRQAVLQHGSVLLQASRWAPELPGVRDLTSQSVPLSRIAERFRAVLSERLRIDWVAAEMTPGEQRRAAEIEADRFASAAWLRRR